MSAATPVFYDNEKHYKTQPRSMDFDFNITGAGTGVLIPVGADCLTTQVALSQAQIDAYLSNTNYVSTNEFLAAAFDTASMGVNAFGGIINMLGQAASVIDVAATMYTGANGATTAVVGASNSATLTASTLQTAVGISTRGNLAFKLVLTGLDAATSGLIRVSVRYISK